MNLRQIEAFKAVMENGTVVRAAEVMHISQPAVTKLIRAFEWAAGFRVFDRVRGRLIPTAEGLSLYREVERVFATAALAFPRQPRPPSARSSRMIWESRWFIRCTLALRRRSRYGHSSRGSKSSC